MNTKIKINRLLHSKFFVSGLILVALVFVITILSPLITVYSPTETSLIERLKAPDWASKGMAGHILGTDQLGRDVFTRLLRGGLASLTISLSSVVCATVLGTVLGLVAGYIGGKVDTVIMRMCDVFLAFPNIILAIAIMSVLGASIFNLVIVLILSTWMRYCRVTRNNVLVVKKQEFVSASRVLGASNRHIMFRQILPNVTTSMIIMATSRIGNAILIEATLSFLNMGIPAPTPSWGNMIADGRAYLTTCPWLVFAPGVALLVTVLAFNFLGDGLRDALDPKRI